MKLYDLYNRSVKEIEEDLAKAKAMKVIHQPTGQHIFYNIPYGDVYKKACIKDFEWELLLAKVRDAAHAKDSE